MNQFVQYELPLYHQLPGIYLDFGTGSLGQFCRPNTVGHTRMPNFSIQVGEMIGNVICRLSGWWFQISFFSPLFGEDSQFD